MKRSKEKNTRKQRTKIIRKRPIARRRIKKKEQEENKSINIAYLKSLIRSVTADETSPKISLTVASVESVTWSKLRGFQLRI